MTESEIVSLKEFIMTQIEAQSELTRQQFEFIDKATRLQAVEYERRLESLNGEANRIREILASCVPRETYDIQHNETIKKIDDLNNFRSNWQGKNTIISIVIPIIVTVILLLLNYTLTGTK